VTVRHRRRGHRARCPAGVQQPIRLPARPTVTAASRCGRAGPARPPRWPVPDETAPKTSSSSPGRRDDPRAERRRRADRPGWKYTRYRGRSGCRLRVNQHRGRRRPRSPRPSTGTAERWAEPELAGVFPSECRDVHRRHAPGDQPPMTAGPGGAAAMQATARVTRATSLIVVLVRGAAVESSKISGTGITIPVRRMDGNTAMSAEAIHSLIVAGRIAALLGRGSK
jgi:hypothetical protein